MAPTVPTMTHLAAEIPTTNSLDAEAPSAANTINPTVTKMYPLDADVPTMTPISKEAPAEADFTFKEYKTNKLLSMCYDSKNPRGYDSFI